MAYDSGLAERISFLLREKQNVTEKKMFGGLAFMVSGHMCCGIVGANLMARVGADQYAKALQRPFAKEMDFTGRPMKGMVFVEPDGFESDTNLQSWINLCLNFVNTLPPK